MSSPTWSPVLLPLSPPHASGDNDEPCTPPHRVRVQHNVPIGFYDPDATFRPFDNAIPPAHLSKTDRIRAASVSVAVGGKLVAYLAHHSSPGLPSAAWVPCQPDGRFHLFWVVPAMPEEGGGPAAAAAAAAASVPTSSPSSASASIM